MADQGQAGPILSAKVVRGRVETGSGHRSYQAQPDHVMSGSSKFDELYSYVYLKYSIITILNYNHQPVANIT